MVTVRRAIICRGPRVGKGGYSSDLNEMDQSDIISEDAKMIDDSGPYQSLSTYAMVPYSPREKEGWGHSEL